MIRYILAGGVVGLGVVLGAAAVAVILGNAHQAHVESAWQQLREEARRSVLRGESA